jgi:phosphotransferase system enzyme I (PtsI)
VNIDGIGVSQGIAYGKTFVLEREGISNVKHSIPADKVEAEITRFEDAINKSRHQLKKFQQKIKNELGDSHAAIFDSHVLVLDDPMLIEPAKKMIRDERVNPEYAIAEIFTAYLEKLEKFDDPYLKARIADFRDVGRRIQMNLAGVEKHPLANLPDKVIVVAYDLSPSETASMDKEKVIGFVTEAGSRSSHTAIMAKALEIPAVVGAPGVTKAIKTGDTIIIDGTRGTVIISPDEETLKEYQVQRKKQTLSAHEIEKSRKLSSETIDGIRIRLAANIELPNEIEHVKLHGARGIGLFRTEFLYLHRDELPTEEDSFKVYRHVVKTMAPDSVTIRTLDIGGDKFVSQLNLPREINPFLGCRAIRLCLQRRDLFKTQLRAILRASVYGTVKLMYPMISGIQELREANIILEETKAELKKEGIEYREDIPVGIMIEIPSAAVTSDILARETDFFSIGTNDLIQYTMAVDRGNEQVAYLYDPLHPAVLRLLKQVIDSAHRYGIGVSMCGEMAGDPAFTPILLGLGLDEFSMAPADILAVKNSVRSIRMEDARKLTQEILELSTSEEIKEYLGKLKS